MTNDNNDDKKYRFEWAKLANEFNENIRSELLQRSGGDVASLVMSKEDFMRMGASLWEHTYAVFPDNDSMAFDNLIRVWSASGQNELLLAAGAPDMQLMLGWVARWADQAFPQVILGQKTAAALMGTSASEEIVENLHAPWKAFLINIPAGLLTIYDEAIKRQVNATLLAVQETSRPEIGTTWNWRLSSSESTVQLWQFGISTKELIQADLLGFSDKDFEELFADSVDDQDKRVMRLIGRLIVGICLTFPGNNKPIGAGHKKGVPSRGFVKHGDEFVCFSRAYELRTPITIDCRESIKDYVSHGTRRGTSPTVRTLVRGTYRRPPRGIEKGLPKTVWVQPHWRGPKDAPIVVRAHKEKNR